MAYEKTAWVNGGPPALSAENLNKIEDELELLDEATTVESPTPTISASVGTFDSAAAKRVGNVVCLRVSIKNSESVDPGGNVFSGTLSPSELRPFTTATTGTYYQGRALMATLTAAGALVIRNCGSTAITATSAVNVTFTYIVN